MNWPPHPDDEWLCVIAFGEATPRYILSRSGAATAVARAQSAYVEGHIDVDELERRLDAVFGLSGERLPEVRP